MTFLAVDVTKPLESAGEKFAYGGQMLLIGMSVVFSVLLILWGALELFHLIVTKLPAALEKKRDTCPGPLLPHPALQDSRCVAGGSAMRLSPLREM